MTWEVRDHAERGKHADTIFLARKNKQTQHSICARLLQGGGTCNPDLQPRSDPGWKNVEQQLLADALLFRQELFLFDLLGDVSEETGKDRAVDGTEEETSDG